MSRVSDLTASLEQESKAADEAQQAAAQERKRIASAELLSFEENLKQQCSTAASSFKSVLAADSNAMTVQIRANSKALTAQIGVFEKDLTKRLFFVSTWGVLGPTLITSLLCLAAGIAFWNYLPSELWDIHDHKQVIRGQRFLVLDDPAWTTCNVTGTLKPTPDQMRPCLAQ